MYEIAMVISNELGETVGELVLHADETPSREEDAKLWRWVMEAIDEVRRK